MENLKIAEIERLLLNSDNVEGTVVESLRKDNRKGVQSLLAKWERKEEHRRRQHEQFVAMTAFERRLRGKGYQNIAGIDEAGRGPLAGPVVAGAVILQEDFYLPGLNDSKKLNESKREEYFRIINKEALAIGIGIVSAAEIDEINILQATKKAMSSAAEQLDPQPDFLLIDAVDLVTPYPSEALIKGDARSITIAAASIIAKVTRDRLMKAIAKEFPHYGFEANMGYGTAFHLEAIKEHGVTPCHRKSFAPVKECLGSGQK
ncbi:ribonuclease HII [Bacillus sp. REN3]|uniref:ribonuclease HII n=1 Tax=Bacillus sp. REN3 TaxID=2802440 RepID=UPI001AED8E01|nr:ribonuclease HII [Bacillus sp. REN3]